MCIYTKTGLTVNLQICDSGKVCKVSKDPLSKPKANGRSRYSNIIMKAAKNLTVPATVLHITPMSALRSDAHVGTYSDTPEVPDCSHWCIPGVPDVWNEMLLSYMLHRNEVPSAQ